jgi:hypothetical protein
MVVSLEIEIWNGCLSRREEWGKKEIYLIPGHLLMPLNEISHKMQKDLHSYSIECSEGRFLPYSAVPEWTRNHGIHLYNFANARSAVLETVSEMKKTAQSAAAIESALAWKESHKENPPPSQMSYASNLAISLIPNKEEFYELFKVVRKLNSHSLLFIQNESNQNILNDAEKDFLAWKVIDELVAGNARRLASGLQKTTQTYAKGRRVNNLKSCVEVFLHTDMVPQLGLTDMAKTIFDIVNGKTEDALDWDSLPIKETISLAKKFSEVSAVLGSLG